MPFVKVLLYTYLTAIRVVSRQHCNSEMAATKEDAMSKEQLLQELAHAFETLIATATEATQASVTHQPTTWGPREIVAHLAGWEVMATVRIPRIVAGMPPLEEADEARQAVMNDAINATITTMIGNQSLEAICDLLRQAYQRDIELLRKLDETFFRPGEYVYERTRSVIEHCEEHRQQIVRSRS